jgi:hypothetical protein
MGISWLGIYWREHQQRYDVWVCFKIRDKPRDLGVFNFQTDALEQSNQLQVCEENINKFVKVPSLTIHRIRLYKIDVWQVWSIYIYIAFKNECK